MKQLVRSLRTKLGKVGRRPAGDAITQMILGIFSRDVPESTAREALDRLRALVVDYNELRVVPPIEMAEMVGALPEARLKCEDLSRALNKVFAHEHEVSLDRLGGLPRKEVIDYLESIDGLDAYSRARVRLLGLQQHAVPLDEATWAYARKMEIVDRNCPLEEAQAFLERRIAEDEALEIVALLEKQAWTEMGAAVRNGEVERIRSIPPDRTARNMLQLVASGRESAASGSQARTVETRRARARSPAAMAPASEPAVKPTRRPRPAKKKAAKRAAKKRKAVRSTAKRKARAASRPRSKTKLKARTKRKNRPAALGKARAKRTLRANAAKRARRSPAKAKSA
ncbi:MAG: hypothetical protein ACE5I3_10385 [Phycisphaerae bacterium]